METRFFDFVDENKLIFPSTKQIVAAVSGGADSVFMLKMLKSLAERLSLTLVICHINHKLRGEDSDRDALFMENLAKKEGLPFYLYEGDVLALAKAGRLSTEEAARNFRYRCLDELAESLGGAQIATGHSANDNAETVVFNLARGTGIRGLRGIPLLRGKIFRPILFIKREEILDYLKENDIKFVHDKTNDELVFTRNKIRQEIIPKLLEINPAFLEHSTALSKQIAQTEDYINGEAEALLSTASDGSGFRINVLSGAHTAVLSQALLILLEQEDIVLSRKLTELILDIIEKAEGQVNLKGRIYAFTERGKFFISKKEEQKTLSDFTIDVIIDETILPDGKIVTVLPFKTEDHENFKKVHDCAFANIFFYDRMKGQAFFRGRRPGDYVFLPRRGISKKLKKLFNEKGLTETAREEILIVEQNGEIIWVEEFGPCTRIPENKNNMYKIFIKQGRGKNERGS